MIILRKEFSDKKKDSSKKVEKVAAGTAIASGVTSVGLAAGQNAEENLRGKLVKKLDKATEKIAKKSNVKVGTDFLGNKVFQSPERFKSDGDIVKGVLQETKAANLQKRYTKKLQGVFDKSIARQNKMAKGSKVAMGVGAAALATGMAAKIARKAKENKKDK